MSKINISKWKKLHKWTVKTENGIILDIVRTKKEAQYVKWAYSTPFRKKIRIVKNNLVPRLI